MESADKHPYNHAAGGLIPSDDEIPKGTTKVLFISNPNPIPFVHYLIFLCADE
jgi:hypothetical protein